MHLIHSIIESISFFPSTNDLMQMWKSHTIEISKTSEQYLSYVFHSKEVRLSSFRKIIEALKEDFFLHNFFSLPAGVSQGYTIEEHTLMVCEIAEKYLTSDLVKTSVPLSYFGLFLSMHDIGKGVAYAQYQGEKHWREKTIEYTLAIAKKIFDKFSIEERYQDLFIAALSKDTLGLYLRNHLTEEQALQEILELSRMAKLPARDFFSFFELYFKADAASYPSLFRSIFSVKKGALLHIPTNQQKITVLSQHLSAQSKL